MSHPARRARQPASIFASREFQCLQTCKRTTHTRTHTRSSSHRLTVFLSAHPLPGSSSNGSIPLRNVFPAPHTGSNHSRPNQQNQAVLGRTATVKPSVGPINTSGTARKNEQTGCASPPLQPAPLSFQTKSVQPQLLSTETHQERVSVLRRVGSLLLISC